MPEEKLRDALLDVEAHLKEGDHYSPGDRLLLERLRDRIEQRLSDDAPEAEPSPGESLATENPKLVALIDRVAAMLTSMGL